jgi:hypothetical protein
MRVVGVKKGFIITCSATYLLSTQHRWAGHLCLSFIRRGVMQVHGTKAAAACDSHPQVRLVHVPEEALDGLLVAAVVQQQEFDVGGRHIRWHLNSESHSKLVVDPKLRKGRSNEESDNRWSHRGPIKGTWGIALHEVCTLCKHWLQAMQGALALKDMYWQA